jgi:hypothetical protein
MRLISALDSVRASNRLRTINFHIKSIGWWCLLHSPLLRALPFNPCLRKKFCHRSPLHSATVTIPFGALLVATVGSIPIRRSVDLSLVPEFGVVAGTSPDGMIRVITSPSPAHYIFIPWQLPRYQQRSDSPCAPRGRQTFINDLNANVGAYHAIHSPSVAISLPSDNTVPAAAARAFAAIVTLHSLNRSRQNCPASSTTFSTQLAAAQSGQIAVSAPAPPALTPPAPVAPPAPAPAPSSVDPKLVPQFGVTAGTNPDGASAASFPAIPCTATPP